MLLERAAPDSREERCLFPGSGGDCWGSDGSPGRWEDSPPWGKTHPSHAGGEGCVCRAGVRNAGGGEGKEGVLEASSMSGRCAGPQRSSGQTHSLASAMREGD